MARMAVDFLGRSKEKKSLKKNENFFADGIIGIKYGVARLSA